MAARKDGDPKNGCCGVPPRVLCAADLPRRPSRASVRTIAAPASRHKSRGRRCMRPDLGPARRLGRISGRISGRMQDRMPGGKLGGQ
ncbi:hypothetical protein JCM14124_21130 [Humidesulfovibrio idahonensis]